MAISLRQGCIVCSPFARRVAIHAAIFMVSVSWLSAGEEKLDRNALAEHLREWRQQFASIRVDYKFWHRDDFVSAHPKLNPDEELGRRYYSQNEFVWSDIGGFRNVFTVFKEGKPQFRDGRGGNGEQPWAAETKFGQEIDRWDLIQLYPNNSARPLHSTITFHAMFGLWDGSGVWFDERIAASKNIEFQETEVVDGHRCHVIQWTSGDPKRFFYEQTLWLDPANCYLPRKYQIRGNAPGKELSHRMTWLVEEFRKVDGHFCFPARGRLFDSVEVKGSGFQWSVENVVLNESFSKAYFMAPQPQAGTRVIDYSKRTAYRAPGSKLKPIQPSSGVAPISTGSSSAVDAKPTHFPWIIVGLLGIGITTTGICLLWARPRRSMR